MKNPAVRIGLWILSGTLLYVAVTSYLNSNAPVPAPEINGPVGPVPPPEISKSPEGVVISWSVTPNEQAALQPAFLFSPYEIHPPPGVNYVTFDRRNASHIWIGGDRPVGMSTHFAVSLVPLTSEEVFTPVEVLQRRFVNAMKGRHQSWTEEPIEVGLIDGIEFRRVAWHGVTMSGFDMKGVLYSTVFDDKFVQILCRDVITENPDIIKQGDLAARTFRRIPSQK